jgi:hypothetical protein
MSAGRELMRVSDGERQVAVDRLRSALNDGRLDLLEYDNRLLAAYQAVTYADLDRLFTDLPSTAAAAAGSAIAPAAASGARAPVRAPAGFLHLPLPLKILWSIWVAVVGINVTVWLLVSLGASDPHYFWPMWLAVPGVALLGVSVGVTALRDGRFSAPPDEPGPHAP